jgi:hypothetical protein
MTGIPQVLFFGQALFSARIAESALRTSDGVRHHSKALDTCLRLEHISCAQNRNSSASSPSLSVPMKTPDVFTNFPNVFLGGISYTEVTHVRGTTRSVKCN